MLRTLFEIVSFWSLVLIPVCLLFALPKATRGGASVGLWACALFQGFEYWLQSAGVVHSAWGFVGVFIGVLLGGGGVIPMAWLVTILRAAGPNWQ